MQGKKVMKEERKYYVKGSWIFNLESIHDKAWCIIYDIRDGVIKLPIEIAGKVINDEGDVYELIDEASDLELISKSRKVTSKEYGKIKRLVEWRVMQRYATCVASGMDESKAGGCFEDL